MLANRTDMPSCQLRRVTALIHVLASLGACAVCPTHYRSSGIVTTAASEPLPVTPALSEVLAKALQPLGFKGPTQGSEGVEYSVVGGLSLGNRVDVVLEAKSQTILVHDFISSGQTQFTQRSRAERSPKQSPTGRRAYLP